jgi:predicted ATPase
MLNTLSHGEGILSYFRGRFHTRGIYFLDEPEAALSPASQIEFLRLLGRLESQGQAQFIITTHSPILLAHPGAQILSFDSRPIEEIDYEETTHYKLYHQFFSDRAAFLGRSGKEGHKES